MSLDYISPGDRSPDVTPPDDISPDYISPGDRSPDVTPPDDMSPDYISAGDRSPDVTPPDDISPDDISLLTNEMEGFNIVSMIATKFIYFRQNYTH